MRDGNIVTELCVQDKRPPRPEGTAVERGLDDYVWTIIEECWQKDPRARPEIDSVMRRLKMQQLAKPVKQLSLTYADSSAENASPLPITVISSSKNSKSHCLK